MMANITLFLIIVAMSSVTAQTFQYSRGWTNGKRDGHRRASGDDVASSLEKIFSPCQLRKLKYVLEGKPLNERLLAPCDYADEEVDQPKKLKFEHSQDPLFDALK